MDDVRYALRMLRKSPAFAAFAILTLALGIGANTAIFSVIDAVMLRPLPYPAAGQLVTLANTVHDRPVPLSIIEVEDYRAQSGAFAALAATLEFPTNLTGGDRPERLEGLCVGPSYFSLLAVPPLAGRTFGAADETPGITNVVILSEAIWRKRFGGSPDAVGRRVQLDDDPYTVVGVMPAAFRHPAPATGVPIDVWVPCGYRGMPFTVVTRDLRELSAIGRLKPEVTAAAAQGRLDDVARRLHQQHPASYRTADRWGVRLKPLAEEVVGDAGHSLFVLLGAVGLVLLIACANVAILLLARAAGRRRELTVRAALGASRGRIVRQLFTESVVLALAGGLLGVLLAMFATDFLVAVSPVALPRAAEVRVDGGVLAFTVALSFVTAVIFGLVPALRASRTDLQTVLNESGRALTSAPVGRLRALLVVAEVALATVLLVGAGLLLRSLQQAQSVAPGFDSRSVHAAELWLPVPNDRNAGTYNDPANRARFAAELARRVRAIPGVADAALATSLPLGRGLQLAATVPFSVVGHDEPATSPLAIITNVSEGYFQTLRVPVRAGRAFTIRDDRKAPPVAIVNRTLARRVWGSADPVGQRLRIGRNTPADKAALIVGVVEDVRTVGLDVAVPDEIYVPYAQNTSPRLVVIARVESPTAAREIPSVVRSLDQNLPVSEVRPLDELLAGAVARRRFVALLLGAFALAALAMAALGIYSVTSYGVAQRRHEIGVRMAVGARASDVLRMVLGQSGRAVAAGVALGLAGAIGVGRLVRELLYGVGATDPLTFAAIAVLLMAVALLATYLPARRAARLDPMIAIRSET